MLSTRIFGNVVIFRLEFAIGLCTCNATTNGYHVILGIGLPGVKGGEKVWDQSPPARIWLVTSPTQPSFTPSRLSSMVKNGPDTGVGKTLQVEGGLLTELPETDNGGVDG